ncbi:MAG: ABC transporter permease [Thiotrichales bacterium]|nr:ABC transporter permease [Thiotrichales bacterium]
MPAELRPPMPAGGAAAHGASVVRRFGRALAAWHWWFTLGMSAFAVIAALLILTPWIAPHDPAALDLRLRMAPPGSEHWLGTDHLGRDVLSRLLEGGRFSVSIALMTLILSIGIGTVLGALSARIGGLFDEALMRIVDLLLSFPEVVVALFLIAILGPGYGTLVLALTITGWTPFARVSRGLALEVNARDYIAAAEVLGCRRRFIVLRHVIPNLVRPIAAISFLRFGHKLITVGGLSFLGLGVQPPGSDWGAMLADARPYLERMPLLAIAPGMTIFITALSVTMIGQGLELSVERRMAARAGRSPAAGRSATDAQAEGGER